MSTPSHKELLQLFAYRPFNRDIGIKICFVEVRYFGVLAGARDDMVLVLTDFSEN